MDKTRETSSSEAYGTIPLVKEAAKLGIDVVTLSKMEMGKIKPIGV